MSKESEEEWAIPSDPKNKYPLFKKAVVDHLVMLYYREVSVCKRSDINLDLPIYKSIDFDKCYDGLPPVVKLWLTLSNWNTFSELSETLGCNGKIYYTALVQENEQGWLCAYPLVIADEENAVVLAPKWVRPEDHPEFSIISKEHAISSITTK